jgi:NADPH:quinone reductase-like Zn-dependent oxidoreductase
MAGACANDCRGRNAAEPHYFVGQHPRAKAPLVLGNEEAGVVEEGGGPEFPAGSRVMFTGPYGVSEDGTYSEWLAVRKQDLCLIPEGIDDVSAARIPVAYLTAQMTLSLGISRSMPLEAKSSVRRWQRPAAASPRSAMQQVAKRPSMSPI